MFAQQLFAFMNPANKLFEKVAFDLSGSRVFRTRQSLNGDNLHAIALKHSQSKALSFLRQIGLRQQRFGFRGSFVCPRHPTGFVLQKAIHTGSNRRF